MPGPGQNIIELGFNVAEFTAQQKAVYDGILQTYEVAAKLDGFKMNINATGWGELKNNVNGATQATGEYESIVKRVSERVAEMNGHSKEHTQLILLETKSSRELAQTKLIEEKARTQAARTATAEIKLREANEKAAEKEAKALEKATAARLAEEQSLRNDAARKAAIAAKLEEEKAAIELAQSLEMQTKAQEELNAAMASAASSGNQPTKLNAGGGPSPGAAAEVVVYRDELERLTGTLAQNESLQNIYKSELAEINAELKLLDKTSIDYDSRLASLTNRQGVLKAEMSSLNTTIKNQIVLENSEAGSLDALNARLNLLNQAYTKLGITAQASPVGVAMKAEIQSLSAAIIEQEGQLNRNQKKVGDYSNAITKAAGGTFSIIRKLAYVLPGIGIAGIISGLVEGVTTLVSSLFNADKAIDQLKGSQDTLNKAFADNSYAKAVKDVKELTTYIGLAKDGFLQKKVVLDEYNKTFGDTIGKAKDLDEAEQLLVKNGDAYIKITLLKAAANIALQEAAQLAVDIAKEQSNRNQNLAPLEDEQKFRKVIENQAEYQRLNQLVNEGYYKSITAGNEASRALNKYYNDQLTFLAGGKKAQNKKTLEDIAADFQKNAVLLSGQFGIDMFGNKDKAVPKPKAGKDVDAEVFKNEQDKRKTLFEIQKRLIQDGIDASEQILTNDKKTFSEKIVAAQNYYTLSQSLIEKQKDFELNEANLQQDEEKRKAEKEIKNKSQRAKAIQSIEDEYTAKRKLITVNANSEIIKLDTASEKQRTEIMKNEAERREKERERLQKEAEDHSKSLHEIEMQQLQTGYDEALLALEKKFAKGKISEKEYNKQKLLLQLNLQKSLLEADIEFTKETLKLAYIRAQASGSQEDMDKVAEGFEKLKSMQVKLATLVSDFFKKKNDDTKKSFTDMFEHIAEVAKGVFDIIGGFVDANVTKQKNAIQELIDANNKYSEDETERINNSTLSEQDKAAKLIQLKAETDAKNQQYEREQKKRDIERAKFEKASAIASIILNTAVAVSKFISKGDIPEAIIAGILGAAQLAVAIATPIPTYAEGTENHPGGDAIAGEGKHKELVQEPGGKSYIVDKPTLIKNLAKGAKVIPLTTDRINEAMYRSMINGTANVIAMSEANDRSRSNSSNDAWRIAKWQAEQTRKALEENNVRPITKVSVINDFGWADYVNRKVFGKG